MNFIDGLVIILIFVCISIDFPVGDQSQQTYEPYLSTPNYLFCFHNILTFTFLIEYNNKGINKSLKLSPGN